MWSSDEIEVTGQLLSEEQDKKDINGDTWPLGQVEKWL